MEAFDFFGGEVLSLRLASIEKTVLWSHIWLNFMRTLCEAISCECHVSCYFRCVVRMLLSPSLFFSNCKPSRRYFHMSISTLQPALFLILVF